MVVVYSHATQQLHLVWHWRDNVIPSLLVVTFYDIANSGFAHCWHVIFAYQSMIYILFPLGYLPISFAVDLKCHNLFYFLKEKTEQHGYVVYLNAVAQLTENNNISIFCPRAVKLPCCVNGIELRTVQG